MSFIEVEKKGKMDGRFVFGYHYFPASPLAETKVKRNKYDKQKGKKTKIDLEILKERDCCVNGEYY